MLPMENISARYAVRPLTAADMPDLLVLARGNPLYYEHMHTRPTLGNLTRDLTALPPRKTLDDKYFLGYYQGDRLTAALDLITGYPDRSTAFIGWFILDPSVQGQGEGTALIGELLAFLKDRGFSSVRLGRVKGNPQSKRFWEKNGFAPTGVETDGGGYTIVVMRRELA